MNESITISVGQEMALVAMYHTLAWDLRHNTRQAPPLKRLNDLFSKKFNTKYEAFDFLHELFKENNLPTLDICDMGDCPDIAEKNIPAKSIGEYVVTWEVPNGVTTNLIKLCQVCYQDLKDMNALREEVS